MSMLEIFDFYNEFEQWPNGQHAGAQSAELIDAVKIFRYAMYELTRSG
jgi:hypothetical protein